MKRHWLKILALLIVIAMWSCVAALSGSRGRYDFGGDFSGVVTIAGKGTGGLSDYGLCVGDTDASPTYGMIRFGDACIGITNYKAGNVDLDKTVIFRNLSGPVTGKMEFLWEEGNGNTRLAIPTSGVGNATWHPRSMLVVGPSVQDTDAATVGYWQSNNNIFNNLECDTDENGSDFGVQNDLEVMGDIFATGLSAYADNAAAVTGGLAVGQFYRTGGDPDLVCVVH